MRQVPPVREALQHVQLCWSRLKSAQGTNAPKTVWGWVVQAEYWPDGKMTHLILSVVAVQPLRDGVPPKWLLNSMFVPTLRRSLSRSDKPWAQIPCREHQKHNKRQMGNNSGQPRPTCELRQPTIPRVTLPFQVWSTGSNIIWLILESRQTRAFKNLDHGPHLLLNFHVHCFDAHCLWPFAETAEHTEAFSITRSLCSHFPAPSNITRVYKANEQKNKVMYLKEKTCCALYKIGVVEDSSCLLLRLLNVNPAAAQRRCLFSWPKTTRVIIFSRQIFLKRICRHVSPPGQPRQQPQPQKQQNKQHATLPSKTENCENLYMYDDRYSHQTTPFTK